MPTRLTSSFLLSALLAGCGAPRSAQREATVLDELQTAPERAVVFCHQCLTSAFEPQHVVKNAAQVRAILEKSCKVKAVFTGHQHSGLIDIAGGITYYSLRALVLNSGEEENAYALAEMYSSGEIRVTGYRKAPTAIITAALMTSTSVSTC